MRAVGKVDTVKRFIASVVLMCAACGDSDDSEGAKLADKVRITIQGRNGNTLDVPEVQTDSAGNLVISGTQGEQGPQGVAGPSGPAVAHIGYVGTDGVAAKDLFFMAPFTVMYDKGVRTFFVVDTLTGKVGGNLDPQATFFASSDCSGERLGRWDVRNLAVEVGGTLYTQGEMIDPSAAESLECFQVGASGACTPCASVPKRAVYLDPVQAPKVAGAFPVTMAVVQ